MCRTAIALISNALVEVTNAELLLKIKGVIALFIQTMSVGLSIVFFAVKESGLMSIQTWGYTVDSLDTFLLTLFDKYAELLKKRFSDDFQEASHYGSPPRFCLLIVLARLFQPMIICQCQSINQTSMIRW